MGFPQADQAGTLLSATKRAVLHPAGCRFFEPTFLLRSPFNPLVLPAQIDPMNSELTKLALAKVGNPNTLINLVSRRVRQLTTGGSNNRPLVADTAGLGAADIALTEIIEDKIAWQTYTRPTNGEGTEAAPKKRKKA